jgi:hypothetical protein
MAVDGPLLASVTSASACIVGAVVNAIHTIRARDVSKKSKPPTNVAISVLSFSGYARNPVMSLMRRIWNDFWW